ncbi:MAG: hypothetical protein KDI82_13755 [Gammaproteobacteria bacterium]|nr:hypothetical protein [Gammaproteobacteria bacterium]
MGQAYPPEGQSSELPADVFNTLNRIRLQSGGYFDFGLPGMGENRMILRGHEWQLWNKNLNKLLISWHGFRNGERQGLKEPVKCMMQVHHSYSRTIIFRLVDSLQAFCDSMRPVAQDTPAQVLAFPGTVAALSPTRH